MHRRDHLRVAQREDAIISAPGIDKGLEFSAQLAAPYRPLTRRAPIAEPGRHLCEALARIADDRGGHVLDGVVARRIDGDDRGRRTEHCP